MGKMSDRFSAKTLSAAGMTICAVGCGILYFSLGEPKLWFIIICLAVLGVGYSFFAAPNTRAVMTSATEANYGLVSSILQAMRSLGHTLGMSLITFVCGMYLGDMPLAQAQPADLIQTVKMCLIVFEVCCIAGIFMARKGKV